MYPNIQMELGEVVSPEMVNPQITNTEDFLDVNQLTIKFKKFNPHQGANRILCTEKGFTDSVMMMTDSSDKDFYYESRMENLFSVISMFEEVPREVSKGHRLCRSTFIEKVKTGGEKSSRLCVAACNDQNHGLFISEPSNCSR